jgi:hypothetical protein
VVHFANLSGKPLEGFLVLIKGAGMVPTCSMGPSPDQVPAGPASEFCSGYDPGWDE